MRNYDRVDLGKSFEIFKKELEHAKEMTKKDEPDAYAHAFGFLAGCATGFIGHYNAYHAKDDLPPGLFQKPNTEGNDTTD